MGMSGAISGKGVSSIVASLPTGRLERSPRGRGGRARSGGGELSPSTEPPLAPGEEDEALLGARVPVGVAESESLPREANLTDGMAPRSAITFA